MVTWMLIAMLIAFLTYEEILNKVKQFALFKVNTVKSKEIPYKKIKDNSDIFANFISQIF